MRRTNGFISLKFRAYLDTFALVLVRRNRFTEETEDILQQIILVVVKFHGPNSYDYYFTIQELGNFYNLLSRSLPSREGNMLMEKAQLCYQKVNECDDLSSSRASLLDAHKNYTPQEITPYFPKNKTIII